MDMLIHYMDNVFKPSLNNKLFKKVKIFMVILINIFVNVQV